jgi:hypothetical protein
MITVPSVGSMLAVIGVALLVAAVLSGIVGALVACGARFRFAVRPTGGTRVPEAPAPAPSPATPAPAVPGPRTREVAGVR